MSHSESLSRILARLDALLAHAVQVATATFGTAPAGDPFRGLYVSDADAARIVQRGVEPLAGQLTMDQPLVQLDEAGPEWRAVAAAFALSQVELDIVALALATEVDLRYERVFGYLHDDVTRRRPTVDLVLQLLCRSFDERLASRHLFAPDAPLVRHGVVRLSADSNHADPPLIGHALRLEEDVVDFLLGRERLDRRLAQAARWDAADPCNLGAAAQAVAERLAARLEGGCVGDRAVHFLLIGPNEPWLTTEKFLDALDAGLRTKMTS